MRRCPRHCREKIPISERSAATGVVPLHLHYEIYERWDGPVVRFSYGLKEIREHRYYEICLQTVSLKRGGFRCGSCVPWRPTAGP